MRRAKYELVIKEIADTYFVALSHINKAKFSSGEEDYYSPFIKYYRDVEEAFQRLTSEQKTIINNEYFYQSYNGWWITRYKTRTFIRLKKMAIKAFVETFYEIH